MRGERLRTAREDLGWTQELLADKTGISRNYVSLLELNRKSPTVETLLAVCGALGISATEIIRAIEMARTSKARRGTK